MYPSKSMRQQFSFAMKFSASLISHIGSSSFSSAMISPFSFRRIWISALLISSSLARRNLVAKPKNCKRRMVHFVGSQSVNEGPDRKSWGNACWNLSCSLDLRSHHFKCTDMLGWTVNFGQSSFTMVHPLTKLWFPSPHVKTASIWGVEFLVWGNRCTRQTIFFLDVFSSE